MLARLLSAYSMAMALVVALYFTATPIIHGDAEEFPIWEVINYFQAVAVVIALLASFMHKRVMENNADTANVIRFLRVNIAFYSALWLFIWFFWKWFVTLNGDGGPELPWTLIDPLFVIVVGVVGRHMWQGANRT